MLELHGSGDPATLKLLICLEELGLPFEFHPLDLARLGNWSEAHRRVAPQGEVPVLVDGGRILADATIALLHLAESNPGTPLLPSAPIERYDVQALNDVLDAALLGAVNLIGWHRTHDAAARAALDAALGAIPGRQKPAGWSAVWRDAESDRLQRAEEKIAGGLLRIEAALDGRPWLVGGHFTVADINAFAMLEGVCAVLPAAVDPARLPAAAAWRQRVRARPAVARALTGAERRMGWSFLAP